MKSARIFVLIVGLLSLLVLPSSAGALEEYTLEFDQTQNAPETAQGTMKIKVVNGGETIVHFTLKGAYPNTVYTIWMVYNVLVCADCGKGTKVPSCPASGPDSDPACAKLAQSMGLGLSWTGLPGFPKEGNGVSPLARLSDAFTSGMGQDPGASFVTDDNGNGEIQVKLDYDLVREAPVSNKDIIAQCVPKPGTGIVFNSKTEKYEFGCTDPSSKLLRITTTWLRKFIGDRKADGTAVFPVNQRANLCANYDPIADPENPPLYNAVASKGMDARLWQCIDPATLKDPSDPWSGLPRVPRFVLDHFRLANHPDDLTHGFIGGNGIDHWIDMVARLADKIQTQGMSSSSASHGPGPSVHGRR